MAGLAGARKSPHSHGQTARGLTDLDMAHSVSWQVAPADRGVRLRAFAAARRHSRLVRVLRVLLPVMGVVTVAGFVVVAHLRLPAGFDVAAARLSVTRDGIVMDRPHLTGFDREHREYTLAADRAVQPFTNPGEVRLERIDASVESAAGAITMIRADSGNYNQTKNTLNLLRRDQGRFRRRLFPAARRCGDRLFGEHAAVEESGDRRLRGESDHRQPALRDRRRQADRHRRRRAHDGHSAEAQGRAVAGRVGIGRGRCGPQFASRRWSSAHWPPLLHMRRISARRLPASATAPTSRSRSRPTGSK